jgi:hypothetical protein
MMSKSNPRLIRFEDIPSSPKNGNGEATVQMSGKEMNLRWENGEIVDVRSGSADAIIDLNLKIKPASVASVSFASTDIPAEEAIRCYKCWVDDQTGAWICLPTAC